VLLGISTFRAKVLPRWSGLLLAVYPLLLVVLLGSFGAGTLAGLLWLALGYALWTTDMVTLTCSEVNFLERRNGKVRLRRPKLLSRRHRSASEEARIGGGPVKGERRKERTAGTL